MLHQIKNNPFKSYTILTICLSLFLFFLKTKRESEARLLAEVDKVMCVTLDTEMHLFRRMLEKCYLDDWLNDANFTKIKEDTKKLETITKNLYETCFYEKKWYEYGNFITEKTVFPIVIKQINGDSFNYHRELLYTVIEDLKNKNNYAEHQSILENTKITAFEPFHTILFDQERIQFYPILLQDVENAYRSLQFLEQHIIDEKARLEDTLIYKPAIVLDKRVLKKGQVLEGAIQLCGIYNSKSLVMSVNGDSIPVLEGVGKMCKVFNTSGEKKIHLEISEKNRYTNHVDKYSKYFNILVSK